MTDIFKGTKWENNLSAKGIILGWINKFKTRPSEALQDRIEHATGLVGDFLERDWGTEVGREYGVSEMTEGEAY